MPLMPGADKSTFKSNVSEALKSYQTKGSFGSSGPINPQDAKKRILAAAYAKQRESKSP
jgi:hypothetical protein